MVPSIFKFMFYLWTGSVPSHLQEENMIGCLCSLFIGGHVKHSLDTLSDSMRAGNIASTHYLIACGLETVTTSSWMDITLAIGCQSVLLLNEGNFAVKAVFCLIQTVKWWVCSPTVYHWVNVRSSVILSVTLWVWQKLFIIWIYVQTGPARLLWCAHVRVAGQPWKVCSYQLDRTWR
jgi:hypothetical protein